MRIALAGNVGARGLEKDRKLITPILESLGHEISFIQFDDPGEEKHDLILCLEVISRKLVSLSELPPILLVNPEWLTPESIKTVQRSYGSVLCKTHEAHRICSGLFGDKARYTGFLSEDRYEPSICRENTVLHIAGQSRVKNTEAVIDAFRWKRSGKSLKARLIVVSNFPMDDLPEGVTILSHLSDEVLRNLQNVCQIHIQPSQSEGFGHVLHEAMSVNASILTTDAPSMNEIHAAYKIPSTGYTLFNSVKMHEVSAIDIYCAIDDMLRLGRNGFAAAGMPRREFIDGNEAFKKAFATQLADIGKKRVTVPRIRSDKQSIAFIGNFESEHSTENHILWALEQRLGYEVEKLQENRIGVEDIYEACEYNSILLWVRTPGWLRIPEEETFKLLDDVHKSGVKTVSVHLDKFFSIPDREVLIGKIPFWRTAYCFTADGSRQQDFSQLGVNHFYMPPAASEVYSHKGIPRDHFRCDVGFVGAKTYHLEHGFRTRLIDFLQKTYGERFKLIEGGLRGHELNDFYASCKVSVGDCFGGGKIPNYYSDRMVETPMRHGFLLSPQIEGMEIPLATFTPENLQDLKEKIEYWLSHDSERRDLTSLCSAHVAKHDTWTERMREILKTVLQ
jgi:glycosyltransferase involved in cell wall biosynthesis